MILDLKNEFFTAPIFKCKYTESKRMIKFFFLSLHSGPVTGQKYKNQSQNFNIIMVLSNNIDIIKQFKTVYILKILMNILMMWLK